MNFLKKIFHIHKWDKWKHISKLDGYRDYLERKCIKCGKVQTYKGITEVNIISGELSPYIFKH